MNETKSLNLDNSFYPTVYDSIPFQLFKFSGGEMHIKLDDKIFYKKLEKVIITHRVNSSDDLMTVLLAVDALRLEGVDNLELVMPYIPYSRQDRKCFNGESFSLKVFANILNMAKLNAVHVYDPHSDVAPALIDNCVIHDNHEFVELVLLNAHNPILISPDAGSNKKANKLAIRFGLDIVKCDKIRDVKTGGLSGFEVFTDDLKGRPCLIVDDICDGGGTFIGLANELKNKNAGKIALFVTHGIFSKGIDVFDGVIDALYCTDSINKINNNKVTQMEIMI